MDANFFATGHSFLAEPLNPGIPSSEFHPGWQYFAPPEFVASASGGSQIPVQPVASSSSSLSSALYDASSQLSLYKDLSYTRPPPAHHFIHFQRKSQPGIRLDSLLAGTTQIDDCYKLLDMPHGFSGRMVICLGHYPRARYCLAVKGRILRFTVQTFGRGIAENVQHYISTNNIPVSLNKVVLVAAKRRIHGHHWVPILKKIP